MGRPPPRRRRLPLPCCTCRLGIHRVASVLPRPQRAHRGSQGREQGRARGCQEKPSESDRERVWRCYGAAVRDIWCERGDRVGSRGGHGGVVEGEYVAETDTAGTARLVDGASPMR